MAFVKVVRRSMRPEEWTDLRYGWIKRALVKDRCEITGLEVRDAHQIAENQYIYDNDYRPLKQGDLYFTPDGSVFIRGSAKIPAEFAGQKTYFLLHTAAEMLVKINGRYAGGIDPNRDRLPLEPFVREDGSFNLEIEAFNRSKPDDERNPDAMDSRGCRQIFTGAWIVTLREDLLKLFYDLTILLDIAKSDEFDEDYRTFLNRELNTALNLVDFDTWEGVPAALDYIEKHIYQNTDFRSSGNVALIGHSHLDLAYYWRRIHVVQKNARTVLIQMRLMDEYPDFHYAHTQPYAYELLKKYYPDLFEELKEKVKSGQFEPLGAMYVEPDCNLPSAESLIRQCLYGQQFYRREFGITVESAWLPDVFGNSWILPQILKKSGVKYFVSNKMSTWNDTNRFPHNNFLWKGIDGSRIYACVPPTHFITWNMPSQIMENWNAYQDKETGGQTLSMFGYGDGGSGATEEMIEMMHRFDKLSVMPKTEHMRADEFLHRNFDGNENLATWDGELYLEMHRGTFTTKSVLKAFNRRLEFKLRTAELLSVLRMKEGASYPYDALTWAWKKLLLNQFHDILPGSHINPVFEDAVRDYEKTESLLDGLIAGIPVSVPAEDGEAPYLHDAFHFADGLDETGRRSAAPASLSDLQPAAEKTVRLFNPLNKARMGITFVEDEGGDCIREGKKGYFVKASLAPLSAGDVTLRASENTSWVRSQALGDGILVETPYYSAKLNADGSFAGLFDKDLSREWTDGGFNKLHLYQDVPGMYDAWDILPNYKEVEYSWKMVEPLHATHCTGTVAEFTVKLATPAGSPWTMIIRFFRESPAIEVEHITDWNEKHRLVKASYGINALSRELVCDTGAGYIRRETHRNTTWQQARFEVCHHKWADFAEKDGGVALINEGKYGLGVEENGYSLSLLRSNIRPDVLSDIGHHDFCCLIVPHEGDHVDAHINDLAFEYNVPPVRTSMGEIPSLLSGCTFEPLYLEAVKLSEDRRHVVFRLCEQNGTRGQMKLPCTVTLTNMLEDPEGETDTLTWTPFEIITFEVPVEKI